MAETEPIVAGKDTPTPESCPELDGDFYDDILNTTDADGFDVLDAWEDDGSNANTEIKTEPEPEEPVNSTSSKPDKSRVSKDPKSSSSSRHRTESERSGSNRDPRPTSRGTRDKENGKSRSPERNRRSPYRSNRFSPPGARRRQRSRSPIPQRRRDPTPPRRNPNAPKVTFLEQMTQQFPEIQQDMIRTNINAQMQYNAAAPLMGFGMNPMMNQLTGAPMLMTGQPMMQGPNFLPQPNFMQQQQFPSMNFNQPQPYQMHNFNNRLINPNVPPGTMQIDSRAPMPVPAPVEAPIVPPRDVPRPPEPDDRERIQEAIKKAYDIGNLPLSDYLRQVSHQTSKKATDAEISSKREKVRLRCKRAAKLLNDLNQNPVRLPFILCPSKKKLSGVRCDAALERKSPLVVNGNNAQFTSQAKHLGLRDALLSNPLRNISGKLFQFSRNLGLDVTIMSQEVQAHVEAERSKEQKRSAVAEISSNNINMALKLAQKGTQTDKIVCGKCAARSAKKFKSQSSQVQLLNCRDATTQKDDEEGSFSVELDAMTMQNMSHPQQLALVEFCRAFKVHNEKYGEDHPIWEGGSQRERDDRMAYANPENPNADNTFISFSPIRASPRPMASMSPVRKLRVTDRLGVKIASPRQHFADDNRLMEAGQSSRFYRDSSPITSYHIPSPDVVVKTERFDRSPIYSDRVYRNRTRSRSRSPPNVRYTKRTRSRSPQLNPVERRGRY